VAARHKRKPLSADEIARNKRREQNRKDVRNFRIRAAEFKARQLLTELIES
jgi:hypothetical protein